jgi:cobalt-zinc-cadmium efflux system protein
MVGHGHAGHGHAGHGHAGHGQDGSARADRRWLAASFVVIVLFMVAEVVAGIAAHSLALITDAGHMITDAAAIGVAIVASRIAERPARGAYTYGFSRVDALSGQANGITLLLLAVWFVVEAVRRMLNPAEVHGGIVTVVALIGVAVNVLATALASRADRGSLNVRGVMAHLLTDIWAFLATFVAGVVVLATGWARADAIASLVVAALMAWTGWALVRAAGRVFLEAAPVGLDPAAVGESMVGVAGVAEIHDLHVWQLGPGKGALSALVLVRPSFDCHEVSERLRGTLAEEYGLRHVTLQADHAGAARHDADQCADAHGQVHIAPGT